MRGRRVAVIGDLMLDAYLIGPVQRISPEAPVPVLEVTKHEYKLGGAANVAACLSQLGAVVKCCGVVNHDPAGNRLLEITSRLGIDVTDVVVDETRPTTCKTRVVARSQQVIRLDSESRSPVSGEVKQQLVGRVAELCRWADAVVLSDYGKGVLTYEICQAAIQAAGRTPVIVDPKRLPWDQYRGATLIKPNRMEAEQFTGGVIQDDPSASDAARELVERLDTSYSLITRSEAGMTLASRTGIGNCVESQHFCARPRELVDVTGAGDVVTSVLALSLAAGVDVRVATWLANIAAGVKVGKLGAAAVSVQEIRMALSVPGGLQRKTMSRQKAAAFAADLRHEGKKVVFTNGCFDLLHVGHVLCLERSRALGDALIVGVNSDASVRRLKGPERPVQSEADRGAIVASQAAVDGVVIFDDDTPQELIEEIQPDILTKGADYKTKQDVVGTELVESWGGRVVLIDLVPGRSTTEIIRKAA